MTDFIIPFLVGVVCIALGISNRRGNLSALHSYHTRRVSAEDRIPFGKKVGLGTIIAGGAISTYSLLGAIAYFTEAPLWTPVGMVLLVLGLIAGLGLSLYAIIRYNKGLF